MPTEELSLDVAIGVTIPARDARGRAARIGPVLDEILSAHNYPPVVERLLAEALTLTALLGSLLKDPQGQMTLQAQTESGRDRPARLRLSGRRAARLCPARSGAARRRWAEPVALRLVRQGLSGDHLRPADDRRALPGHRPAGGRQPRARRRRAISPSPSRSRASSASPPRSGTAAGLAGGLLFQHLPEGEEGRERIHTQLDHPDWPHVAILAGSVKPEELTDPELPLDDLIWRLFHEEAEVRTFTPVHLRRGCRCDPDYVRSVIARFPEDERQAMVGPDGLITVDCAFCSTSFPITLEDVS